MDIAHARAPATAGAPDIDRMIRDLEAHMPGVQMRNGDVFALANAWAERHDAILALTPPADRGAVEARLCRIGIRWGVMPGVRVTTQFRAFARALAADPPAHED